MSALIDRTPPFRGTQGKSGEKRVEKIVILEKHGKEGADEAEIFCVGREG